MYVATERGTSDNTEATRFSQCAHDQRRRLEAADCDSIRCAQLISGGRRRIRPPLPRSRSPHNVLHSPSYSLARAQGGAHSGSRCAAAPHAHACALLRKRRAHPTATFELGDQAIKVDFKRDQAIKGRFRRSKFLIPVANASTGGA